MVVRRRGIGGGSWHPEQKKANMWPGRGNIVVAHGRLPSPLIPPIEKISIKSLILYTYHVNKIFKRPITTQPRSKHVIPFFLKILYFT